MGSVSDFYNQMKQYQTNQSNYNNMIQGNQHLNMGNQLGGLGLGFQQAYYPLQLTTQKSFDSESLRLIKKEVKEPTNIEWLDQRVNEMRIKL